MTVQTPFNTANYEYALEQGGLEKNLAKAHRLALEIAFTNLVTQAETGLMESRIELAIAKQTVELQKSMADLAKLYLGWTLGIVGGFLGVATIIFKLH